MPIQKNEKNAVRRWWLHALMLALACLTLSSAFGEEAPTPAPVEAEPSVRKLAPDQIPLPLPRLLPRRKDYSKRKEYRMPSFDPSWNLSKEIYEKASLAYDYWSRDLENNRFVTVVDLGKKSSERRFFIFDLEANRMDDLLTTHGKGSDPENDGTAEEFSNEEDSLKSSLGNYITLNSYTGQHGYSLRLRGLEDSNSNVEERAIVIHSAPYVSELSGQAGRSWGCLVLDPIIVRATIDRLKSGSLIVVESSAPPPPPKKKIEEKKPAPEMVPDAKSSAEK
ncbi:MAG: murein L,D-transpeptidase catalytic domain family protein [Bdellovibrionota bacterium]